jgi:hypothetical protein
MAAGAGTAGLEAGAEPLNGRSPRGVSCRRSVRRRGCAGRRIGTDWLGTAWGGKNLAHGDGILDRADQSQPPATVGTRQHVDRESIDGFKMEAGCVNPLADDSDVAVS